MRIIDKKILNQIEELKNENERLKAENSRLQAENRELKNENAKLKTRVENLETTLEERIAKAVAEAVKKATEPLLAIIAEKDKEILRLKSQLDKDSTNSSKPPSSDGFKRIPNNREQSSKKQGGQHNHRGVRLNIPKNMKELVDAGLAEHIIISEVAEGDAYTSDWVVDIKITTLYTEYRRKPGTLPKIEYGPRLKSMAVLLCVVGLVAYKRLSEFIRELTKGLIPISKATLASFNHGASEAVPLEQYVCDLLNGKVINVDDTQIKTSERPDSKGKLITAEKTTFGAYIRTYSNATTTVLRAHPVKSEATIIADNILTQFHGILSHDHEAKFYNYGNSNSTCCAHLTRELKGMGELQMLEWANGVRLYFLEMNEHKLEDIRDGRTSCNAVVLRSFEDGYDKYVTSGRLWLETMELTTFGYDELRRMVNRLEKYKNNYMLFIRDYDAPFTNNLAERDLRHCKTRQKVSGCFRSWQGVLEYCRIRSFLSTVKKRGQNLLDALTGLFINPLTAGQ